MLDELADLYDRGTDWATELAGRHAAGTDAAAVVDAAFARYAPRVVQLRGRPAPRERTRGRRRTALARQVLDHVRALALAHHAQPARLALQGAGSLQLAATRRLRRAFSSRAARRSSPRCSRAVLDCCSQCLAGDMYRQQDHDQRPEQRDPARRGPSGSPVRAARRG